METQHDIRREILSLIHQNGESVIDPGYLARRLGISVAKVRDSLQILQNQGLIESLPDCPSHIFIGHGRSPAWKDLKDFLSERLDLPWDEFDREPTAGMAVTDRFKQMLSRAIFAFLVMTPEDEHPDGTQHARENVIHEIGLFQGKLGFNRAIVLLEAGCQEFSNIHGLLQIHFPRNNILSKSEDIRRVLEREGIF